jgi:GNAT superfamily N-acetyltransferase
MRVYHIATPGDVIKVGKFMTEQSDNDRQLYYGYNMNKDTVLPMYQKMAENLNKQTFIVAKETLWSGMLGFIHLAHTDKRIELGIYVKPDVRNQGIGGNLLAMAMLYTFVLMNKDMEMQCINRNYDIRKLIADYDKTLETYPDEQVAILSNTVENQRKAISRLGRAMWNF